MVEAREVVVGAWFGFPSNVLALYDLGYGSKFENFQFVRDGFMILSGCNFVFLISFFDLRFSNLHVRKGDGGFVMVAYDIIGAMVARDGIHIEEERDAGGCCGGRIMMACSAALIRFVIGGWKHDSRWCCGS
ncbi:hypothetical protein V8G54_023553 [Vigna mungo]|uniref:Uncharacterized protein n=1 Tax=Vigna mungo TaxID=3915 RepID=A0AAQ3RQE8_VIGMU